MRHDEMLGLLHYLLAPGEQPSILWAARYELVFWLAVFLLTALLASLRPAWVLRAEGWFYRISQHRGACVAAIFCAVPLIRIALLPLIPVPVPVMLDEFSYLLGADTFATGRLTNPAHPMWVHFESIHINVLPTYQSMYPPAQAMVLALGQKLTGSPWAGVVFSVAVMCAALCWMLQQWIAPEWALLGATFAVLRFGIFSYWINSYWGGAVAATGGALLLGAFARIRRKPSMGDCLLFAAGLLILANSRPLEGFLFSLPLMLAACVYLWRSRRAAMRVALPAIVLLALGAGWMLYYNWCGTGHALTMPYTVNQREYHVSKPFFFQSPGHIPHYRHPEMRVFYMYHEYGDRLRARYAWGAQAILQQNFSAYYEFLAWPVLLLLAAGVPLALADAEMRIVCLAIFAMLVGLALQIWPSHGHYAAPGLGGILLLLLFALRRIRHGGSSSLRLWFSRVVVLLLFAWMLVPTVDRLWNPYALENYALGDLTNVPRQMDRERIASQLERTPGEHLVLVHYGHRDVPSVEWVYNRADIDHAKVVWARDMGEEGNKELLRYFPHRSVWYVNRSSGSLLEPYSSVLAFTANSSPALK